MNCWELTKCAPEVRKDCPAHPDRGDSCWKVTGTMCGGGLVRKATLAEKIVFCRSCAFFRKHVEKF